MRDAVGRVIAPNSGNPSRDHGIPERIPNPSCL